MYKQDKAKEFVDMDVIPVSDDVAFKVNIMYKCTFLRYKKASKKSEGPMATIYDFCEFFILGENLHLLEWSMTKNICVHCTATVFNVDLTLTIKSGFGGSITYIDLDTFDDAPLVDKFYIKHMYHSTKPKLHEFWGKEVTDSSATFATFTVPDYDNSRMECKYVVCFMCGLQPA